tara:strand:+ start:1052 stop:1978 length:927 start_codon:yes stop_codon:yes gene_type:complete
MAINVDTVYKTVLLILNKEQRGYLTPDEFNKTATQVQLEIFGSYFDDLNQQLRIPDNDSEYADRIKNVDEQLSVFKTIGNCTNVPSTNRWLLPTSSGSTIYSEPTITTVIGQSQYTLTTLTQAQLQNGLVKVYFSGVLQSSSAYTITGSTIILTAVPAAAFPLLITATANDFFRLGTVIYNDETELQRIQRNDLLYVNRSPLTKPTKTYPLYIYEGEELLIYPSTVTSGISVSFVRKPKDVIWNFTAVAPTFTYVYSPNTSQQFELMPSEQINVISRILLYSGVIIKDPQIIQVAASQVQSEQANSKT